MSTARFEVDADFLADLLHLPRGTAIVGAAYGAGGVELTVTHPDIPDNKSGCIPKAHPQFRTQDPVVFTGWGLR